MAASGAASPIIPTADTLAASALPARVRRILEILLEQLQPQLKTRLEATADALEQELFSQAERARSNELQGASLADLQQLRKHRGRMLLRMLSALESELANLRTPRHAPEEPTEFHATLTLVADDTIDQNIVLQEIARRHEARHHEALHLLSQRFGVLAGSPALEENLQPLSPHSLCNALRVASAALEMDLPAQLQFYRVFEQHGMASYGDLLEQIGDLLSQQGVLPGLVFAPQRARTPSGRAPDPRHTSTPAAATTKPAPRTPAQARSAAPNQPQAPLANFAALQSLLSASHGRGGGVGQSASSSAAPASAPTPALPAAARLGGRPSSQVASGSAIALPTDQVLGTLQTMQMQVAQGQVPQAPMSLAEVRERTLSGLRRAHGPDAQLTPADADTFELLDLLYHEIGREVRKGPASELLGQLQVPLVQAALNDPEFFMRPQHPARELLNAVAESGANWLGDDEIDPVLLQKLRGAVTKVLADYSGDEAVFEQAHREVQEHFQTATRKAEVAERRHVEAARGRDRLELAKRGAADLINSSLAGRQPAPFVQALLTQAWADVLTLTQLRNGQDSAEWREVAGITAHIAQAVSDTQAEPQAELSPRIERALVQVGYHSDEAAVIAQRLSGDQIPASGAADLAARLQARAKAAPPAAPPKPELAARTVAEQASYETLRKQPFGTWFEFVHNQQGDVRRLRLSWFNPTSDHALFVNQRGQKVDEHTLDGVARLMARGQARVITEDRSRLIDRAWQATVGKLRDIAGVSA